MNPVPASVARSLRDEARNILPTYALIPRYDTEAEQRFLVLELAARAGCHDAVHYLGQLIPRYGHGHHVIDEARKAISKPRHGRTDPLEHQLILVKELATMSGCYGVLPTELMGSPEETPE